MYLPWPFKTEARAPGVKPTSGRLLARLFVRGEYCGRSPAQAKDSVG